MHTQTMRSCLALLCCVSGLTAQDTQSATGLILNEAGALPGYTLLGPSGGRTIYLIDMEGIVVHRWQSDSSGNTGYLLEDGSLLRAEQPGRHAFFTSGGAGGRISRYSWDSTLLWRYDLFTDQQIQHHDIEPLPNGNVLVLGWELKTREEAIAAGRDPERVSDDGIWPEYLVELRPIGEDGAEVVWEWHLWDHLIQDIDQSKSNFGSVAGSPGKVDFNFAANRRADWTHANGIHYNVELDQIAISVRRFSEAWIVDHGATSEEAAGPAGDLLYRWGNPLAYGQGSEADQRLYLQHDVRWIEAGRPGAGNLMAFNNGQGRPAGNYSSIEEWTAPLDAQGRYVREADAAFGPQASQWSYADEDGGFYSSFISGAHRLSNGNTLICSGAQSRIFEV